MTGNHFTNFLLAPQYRVARHLFLQFVVFLITVNILWNVPIRPLSLPQRLLGWAIYFISIDVVFYINLYWLFPRFLLKGRLLTYAFGVLSVSLVIIVAVAVFQILTVEVTTTAVHSELIPILINAISGVLAMGFTIAGMSAILLLRHWILYNQRVDELQSATLHSELRFLKNQINPHFLFNMLNNANVLIRKNPAEASQVLFKLEDLLRYQMNDNFREHVPLRSDIRFLNDYLNLEKIRRDHFDYSITEEGEIDAIQLPALLFIPFVENAVKHNFDSEHLSYVHLFFKVDNDRLEFRCENSKPAVAIAKSRVGGIGLTNIRRRLELLYPGRYLLEVVETENQYTVTLKLNL
ncbi:sensor histidine kinase [Bacteroides cellulosilyticus]|jgi:LytS/YehU family sensor histidine kinase|uniref:sensor histidine kinase n=1 Tax=Bacteroides cellulosilyticus TaxID=246787 RepID=UPI001C37C5D4|nr:histidine kinase [Bacteroides cellulosilyticus]MBV3637419.1 histidine kinase [Bacteroides cellulosilyticus]MBV3663760.1 histidine kinase [Bacteroides cellulosilyticus]MBV3685751.1 histidine kinase [Bacteroides cellulosilyticus]MBV3694433.1 histidine kinase [Bacteroides cellulosilyticus]MBV3707959.1 histidine kinase [Bacteroides cellulosilyticus]